jgi:hypothetical protein
MSNGPELEAPGRSRMELVPSGFCPVEFRRQRRISLVSLGVALGIDVVLVWIEFSILSPGNWMVFRVSPATFWAIVGYGGAIAVFGPVAVYVLSLPPPREAFPGPSGLRLMYQDLSGERSTECRWDSARVVEVALVRGAEVYAIRLSWGSIIPRACLLQADRTLFEEIESRLPELARHEAETRRLAASARPGLRS